MTLTDEEIEAARALCEKATPGPWASDVDQFNYDEIDACVSDEHTKMLATIGTGVVPITVADGVPWSQALDEQNKSLWSKARCSQAKRDADFIAAARTLVPKLIAEVERLNKLCRTLEGIGPVFVERDALRAEVERMRPIYDLAVKVADCAEDYDTSAVDALICAVDDALAKESTP